MVSFEEAHAAFIQTHLLKRTGERRGRLERGHLEAEKAFCRQVWWPLQGNFDGLHPEFEVLGWRGRSFFCDFVWITPAGKLVIEIKGYGAHVRDMDRQKYCNELNRETFLNAIGFQVISFSYDDISQRPELCTALLRMVMSRYHPHSSPDNPLSLAEQEVMRLSCRLARPLRPIEVQEHLHLSHRTPHSQGSR